MNFKRKKIKGQNQKVQKTWLSGDYRIVWRKEVYGVRVPPRFQATVRTILPHGEMWDFVGKPLFKTFKAAQEACEKHEQLWTKATEATGIRALQELFGRVPLGFPVWVKSKLSRKVYGLLMDTTAGRREECETLTDTSDDLSDRTRTLGSSVLPTEATKASPTPVLPVKESDQPSTGHSTLDGASSAPPATGPAKERKKRAAKPTEKRSRSTSRKRRITKGSSGSEKKPSRSSPKRKSPQSRN